MKSMRVGIASVLTFLLCVTGIPFLGSMAQASSLIDITDSVEMSSKYFVYKDDGWMELQEEDFLENRNEGKEKPLKIDLEWSIEDVDVLEQDSFFNFVIPEISERLDFDLLSENKDIIGTVSVDKEGKGKAVFNKLDEEKDKQSYATGVIEIELPLAEQVNDAPEEQNEAPEGEEEGSSSLRAPPNGPSTFYVEYYVYINGHKTLVDSFDNLPAESLIPETGYDLPAMDGQTFVYWYDEAGSPDVPYDMETRVTKNLALVARYANAYYVSFKSVGSDVDDQLVNSGAKTTPPSSDPERKGYTFKHWSEQENGDAFDFNTPITKTTTLYAVWTPVEVTYRIAHWVEKTNIPFGFDEQDISKYDFVYEDKGPGGAGYKALTGSTVSVSDQDPVKPFKQGNGWTWNTQVTDPMYGFVGSEWAWSTEETVKGDGSTIINVYYKRYEFTYEFHFNKAAASGAGETGLWLDDNVKYTHLPGTVDEKVYDKNSDPPYKIKAKYGQDVYNEWPRHDAKIQRTSGANQVYVGWAIPGSQFLNVNDQYEVDLGVGSVTQYLVPQSGLNGATAWVCPFFTNQSIVYENHTYVTRGSWWPSDNYGREKLGIEPVKPGDKTIYYREADGDYTLPGFDTSGRPRTYAPAGFESVQFSDGNYNVYGNRRNGSDYPSLTWHSDVQHYDGTTTYIRLVNYGNRLSYDLAFNSNGGSSVNTKNLEFEYPLDNQAPADPTKANADFDGWYVDPFFVEKFEWTNNTMPANSIMLYAKWIPRDHKVAYVEKDGTEIGVDYYGSGATILEPGPASLGGSTDYEVGKVVAGKGTFLGWQWRPSASYAPFDRFGAEIYRDYTLYASWGSVAKVRYDAAGGSGTPPVDNTEYFTGTHVEVLDGDMLSKNGRPFIGWRLQDGSASANIYTAGSRVTIQKDIVFAAVYEPNLASMTAKIDKKVYKNSDGTVENKATVKLTVPAHDTGLEANITVGSDVTSLRYVFVPYDKTNSDFMATSLTLQKFTDLYNASTHKGELVSGRIESTGSPQEFTYQVDVPDNGRVFFMIENLRYVLDGRAFNFAKANYISGTVLADNVYTPVTLKHEGIGKVAEQSDVTLYDPTNVNVVKTNNDSDDTEKPLDTTLYGLPLDATGKVISDGSASPLYGYDTVEIKSYEAVGDVGLPSGIKPFWKFMLPQELTAQETLDDVKYVADFVHPFNYERNDLKPAKFLKVDSAKQPITSDIATFTFKNAVEGQKVVDEQGSAQDQIVLSTTASDPFIVVPMQYPGSYTLTETKAPGGYNLLTLDIIITVDDQGNMEASLGSQSLEKAPLEGADVDTYSAAFYIVNKTAAELPGAGGIGTLILTIASAIILFAAALLFQRRRRGSRA